MPEDFPHFESEEEMRDWFERADLSQISLETALDVAIAAHVQLSVGEDPSSLGSSTGGASGTLRQPVRLVPS